MEQAQGIAPISLSKVQVVETRCFASLVRHRVLIREKTQTQKNRNAKKHRREKTQTRKNTDARHRVSTKNPAVILFS